MNKSILGIDLGTSSVKLMLRRFDGTVIKAKAPYVTKNPDGWMNAIKEAFSKLCTNEIDAIGLSSQVGTYIINGKDVIEWNDGAGRYELDAIKSKYSRDVFITELAMPHPDIISYPIPRLIYIRNHWGSIASICQPKDLICKEFTGNYVTDKYSYRGLAHTALGTYSDFFLNEIGIDKSVLPVIAPYDNAVGMTTEMCEKKFGIPAGIPVFTGINDFFSSLVGMGMEKSGDMFDVTGTSEHLGLICDGLVTATPMVSGVYFDRYIHYGVTASSGVSLDFGLKHFGLDGICAEECLKHNPPIFTPYLSGERAPIFDSSARGVFFGIGTECEKQDLAYSVMEGVVFSLYHIYENMGCPEYSGITVSGGASGNSVLNKLKAEMFTAKVYTLEENDTSVLGAIALAAKAMGVCGVNERLNKISGVTEPDGRIGDILHKRYGVYKNIYLSLKEQFQKFSDMGKDMIK